MKLLLPSSNSLPTDAELECSWGDGTTFQTLVGKTKISKYENHDLVILRGPVLAVLTLCSGFAFEYLNQCC